MLVYYEGEKGELQGPMALYVEDSLSGGKERFKRISDQISKTFGSNGREYLPF